MRKKKIQEPQEKISPIGGNQDDNEQDQELSDANSIEEFIKIRKLQNQILEKMLEKISHPHPKESNHKKI